VPSNLM